MPLSRPKPYIARRANLSQASAIAEKQNQWHIGAIPPPCRGAYRDRHGRWKRDAMDAERHETNAAPRTAKPCGPGAPGLALNLLISDVAPSGPTRRDPQATVTIRSRTPGRARNKPLTTLHREGRGAPVEPVVNNSCVFFT